MQWGWYLRFFFPTSYRDVRVARRAGSARRSRSPGLAVGSALAPEVNLRLRLQMLKPTN